jgi:hypothetical protein
MNPIAGENACVAYSDAKVLLRYGLRLAAFAAVLLLAFGCASPNVNPPVPRPNTGYLDFYSGTGEDLAWEIQTFDAGANRYVTAFFDVNPPRERVLRLAFRPGRLRVRVTVLNRAIMQPADIELEVRDGKITPVRVELKEDGKSTVDTKRESLGGTVYGGYGRRTKIRAVETTLYTISPSAGAPVDYRPKDQMPYARHGIGTE